jgi:large subunit ribosomal protein L4
MASARLFNMEGNEVGSVDLSDAVFDVKPNTVLVQQVAVALRNAKRQGTASTKTRAQVRGGGRKPYRQKGTGRARQGSIREPKMRGGGVAWGPHPHSYRQDVPAPFKRGALCCVLSERVRRGALSVLDRLRYEVPKTRPFAALAKKLSPEGRKTLFVTTEVDRNTVLSARNLQGVTIRTAQDVNAVDVLDASRIVVVQDALARLEERLL